MYKSTNRIAFLVIFFAITIFMYKDTPGRDNPSMPSVSTTRTKNGAAAPDISYAVSMSKPWTHLLEVEMRFKWDQMPSQAELKMPVWTPGSYLVREYARHVQDFAVKDAGGKDLTWRKIHKNTWQVDTAGAKDSVASYRVYANELTD